MDPFTAAFLADLTANLTAHMLAAAGRRLRETISGNEGEQAVGRCVQAGLVALLASASSQSPEETTLLADIFEAFFVDPDAGRELAALLKGQPPDLDELAYLFEQAGYDPGTLPGLDLAQGLTTFEAAFLTAAVDEPALQGTIQTGQLLTQTRLQRELLDTMRELVGFLRQAQPGSLGIQAGQVTAHNVVSGVQIVYRLPPVEPPPTPGDWERLYLRTLISHCDPLT